MSNELIENKGSGKFTDRDLLIGLTERVDYLTKLVEHVVGTTSALPGKDPIAMTRAAIGKIKNGLQNVGGLDSAVKSQLNAALDAVGPIMEGLLPTDDEEVKDDN